MMMGKLFSLAFLSLGVFILIQVILPIVSFQIFWLSQRYSNKILVNPAPPKKEILGISIKTANNFPYFYSDLKRETAPNYAEFSLSVPALKIENSPVELDSNDLSKKLAHLPGSALPGAKGNVFISGHSAISWIFRSQNAIFARLSDLKKGDEIRVSAGGTQFTYRVVESQVVDPTDLSVIDPKDELGRYITLMTCVPPGLNIKRLVVLGKMI